MGNFLKILWDKFAGGSYFVSTRIPPLFVYIIGYYFVFKIFCNLSEDTTLITNSAFALLASLSGLSLSCARAIEETGDDRDRFTYAGERFLHAAIMALTASILKYAFLSIKNGVVSPNLFLSIFGSLSGVSVGILFIFSLGSAHGGLIVLNKLLWKRINRYPDWNNFL